MSLADRVKTILPFWGLSFCYFIIPFLIDPIDPPKRFIKIDMEIPFIWWMIIPYYLYYVSLLLPLFIKDNLRLKTFVKTAMALLLLSYFIFLIWPISCEPILMTRTDNPLNFMHGIITFPWLYQNAFPSVHVIIGTLVSNVIAWEYPDKKWLFWVGAGLIFFATFLIKQHYLMDAIAGLIMGIMGYYYWKNQIKEDKQ
jgi:membrane-associated phospholipid phosphatase